MQCFERWINVLRYKAGEYEHTARAKGEEVASPSLDDICNEMKAVNEFMDKVEGAEREKER